MLSMHVSYSDAYSYFNTFQHVKPLLLIKVLTGNCHSTKPWAYNKFYADKTSTSAAWQSPALRYCECIHQCASSQGHTCTCLRVVYFVRGCSISHSYPLQTSTIIYNIKKSTSCCCGSQCYSWVLLAALVLTHDAGVPNFQHSVTREVVLCLEVPFLHVSGS